MGEYISIWGSPASKDWKFEGFAWIFWAFSRFSFRFGPNFVVWCTACSRPMYCFIYSQVVPSAIPLNGDTFYWATSKIHKGVKKYIEVNLCVWCWMHGRKNPCAKTGRGLMNTPGSEVVCCEFPETAWLRGSGARQNVGPPASRPCHDARIPFDDQTIGRANNERKARCLHNLVWKGPLEGWRKRIWKHLYAIHFTQRSVALLRKPSANSVFLIISHNTYCFELYFVANKMDADSVSKRFSLWNWE